MPSPWSCRFYYYYFACTTLPNTGYFRYPNYRRTLVEKSEKIHWNVITYPIPSSLREKHGLNGKFSSRYLAPRKLRAGGLEKNHAQVNGGRQHNSKKTRECIFWSFTHHALSLNLVSFRPRNKQIPKIHRYLLFFHPTPYTAHA
jgi:hypothetical protein